MESSVPSLELLYRTPIYFSSTRGHRTDILGFVSVAVWDVYIVRVMVGQNTFISPTPNTHTHSYIYIDHRIYASTLTLCKNILSFGGDLCVSVTLLKTNCYLVVFAVVYGLEHCWVHNLFQKICSSKTLSIHLLCSTPDTPQTHTHTHHYTLYGTWLGVFFVCMSKCLGNCGRKCYV